MGYEPATVGYGSATVWKMKSGKYTFISNMTDTHLINTIKMLHAQLDGSIHDEFVHDNIISMENELKRRRKMDKITNVDLRVVGVTFKNEDTGEKRGDIIRELMGSETPESIQIKLEREPNNMYDVNAIKVIADGRQIGYIGKDYAVLIAPLMDSFEDFTATVKSIGEFKNRPYCEITINQL